MSEVGKSTHEVLVTSAMELSTCADPLQQPFPVPLHVSITPQPKSPSMAIIWPSTATSGRIHASSVKLFGCERALEYGPEYMIVPGNSAAAAADSVGTPVLSSRVSLVESAVCHSDKGTFMSWLSPKELELPPSKRYSAIRYGRYVLFSWT